MGPTGATGPTGSMGPTGPSSAFASEVPKGISLFPGLAAVAELILPAGSFVATAVVALQGTAPAGTQVGCQLGVAPYGGPGWEQTITDVGPSGNVTVSMNWAGTVSTSGTSLVLYCDASVNGETTLTSPYAPGYLTAIEVGHLGS